MVDDTSIQLAVSAASAAIDKHCGRTFGLDPTAATRDYVAWGQAWIDIADVTGLDDPALAGTQPAVSAPSGSAAQYLFAPAGAPSRDEPYTRLVPAVVNAFGTLARSDQPLPSGMEVRVVGRHGWPVVPALVGQAALIQSMRFFQRRHSPYGIAGSPEAGSEMRLQARLDPDVEMSLRPYVRPQSEVGSLVVRSGVI